MFARKLHPHLRFRLVTLQTTYLSPFRSSPRKLTYSCRQSQGPVPDDDLFTYTSGRFLYNESARLGERHVSFDVAALETAVEKHVGHGNVKSLTKLSEGGFNRVLLATMEDGFRAVVKISYKISVPKTYATASEVATLTFLRSKGIPVPEVYGWSSTNEDSVGVEYIIMEHALGVGADTCWFDTTKYQKKALVTGIVGIEKKLFDVPLLLLAVSISNGIFLLICKANYISPGRPTGMKIPRPTALGPSPIICFGKNPNQYLLAIANKEIQWTEQFGKPIECDFPHNTVFPGVNSHQDYLILLKKYLAIAPYLLPKDPRNPLNRPTLRHPDLYPSNVFVCPNMFNPTCIIDWQHTVVTPLFLAAGYPRLFENPDPEPPTGLVAPKYPDNYNTLSPEEKAQVDELIRRQSLFYLYRVFNGGLNKVHLQALQDPLVLSRQHLVDFAGRQWSGNLMTLRGALMRMRDIWLHVPGNDGSMECPIAFSGEEMEEQTKNEPMWYNLNRLVSHWRDVLGGVSEEGWVRTEQYDYAVKRNEALRAEFSEGGSADELEKIKRGWPFQDHEEIF